VPPPPPPPPVPAAWGCSGASAQGHGRARHAAFVVDLLHNRHRRLGRHGRGLRHGLLRGLGVELRLVILLRGWQHVQRPPTVQAGPTAHLERRGLPPASGVVKPQTTTPASPSSHSATSTQPVSPGTPSAGRYMRSMPVASAHTHMEYPSVSTPGGGEESARWLSGCLTLAAAVFSTTRSGEALGAPRRVLTIEPAFVASFMSQRRSSPVLEPTWVAVGGSEGRRVGRSEGRRVGELEG